MRATDIKGLGSKAEGLGLVCTIPPSFGQCICRCRVVRFGKMAGGFGGFSLGKRFLFVNKGSVGF